MSLSVCLITRDAEDRIERAIRSVSGVANEVLVGDTGSTDGTVQRARAAGARVIEVPWEYDFADAQNRTVVAATGDWILWMNPDEELVPPSGGLLTGLLTRTDVLAYTVRVLEITRPEQTDRALETIRPRLFRRHPALRFRGRLHPHFDPPLEQVAQQEKLQLWASDLVVRHHAYLNQLDPDKLRWVIKLLEMELRDRPGQLHYLIEYGRNLLRANDARGHEVLAEAAEQILDAREAPTAPMQTVTLLLEYLLTVGAQYSTSRVDAKLAEELALRWFPASPPLLWVLAQRAYQAEDFRSAADLLERLIHLGRTGTYDRGAAFDPSLMAEPAALNLGNCYLRLGDLDRAELWFGQVLASPTPQAREQGRQGYAMVQELRRKAGSEAR